MRGAQRRDPARAAPHGHRPVRTCVGCRARTLATELLRVVAVDGEVVVDDRHGLPGRGAWLHPDPDCLHRAQRRKAFGRALRASRPLATTAVQAHVAGLGADRAREIPAPRKD